MLSTVNDDVDIENELRNSRGVETHMRASNNSSSESCAAHAVNNAEGNVKESN